MSLPEIKKQKNIPDSDNLFDRAGLTELAANAFRATQTKEALKKRNIRGEKSASDTHFQIAQKVRTTMKETGGTMPEDLLAEPSIAKLAQIKQAKRISN